MKNKFSKLIEYFILLPLIFIVFAAPVYASGDTSDVKTYYNSGVSSCLEGKTVSLRIYASEGTVSKDFALFFNDTELERTFIASSYGKFSVPPNLAPAIYKMSVMDGGAKADIGEFEVIKYIPTAPPLTFTPDFTQSAEGVSVSLRVRISGGTCSSDMKLFFDDIEIPKTFKATSYCKFKIPNNLDPGEYSLTVKNGGWDYDAGTYTVGTPPAPIPDPIFGSIDVSESYETFGATVRLSVDSTNIYAPDFGLFFDSLPLTISSQGTSHIDFIVPDTLPVGTYNLKAINKGKPFEIATYEVKAIPDPLYGTLDITESIEKLDTTVRLSVDRNNIYWSDFSLFFDTTKLSITSQTRTEIAFSVPKTLSPGTYTLKALNRGKTVDICTYEIKVTPPPPPKIFDVKSVDVNSAVQGTAKTVRVNSVAALKTYGLSSINNFTITIAGTEYKATTIGTSYFKFKVPGTLPVGSHDISINKGGISQVFMTFKVTPPPPPPIPSFSFRDEPSGSMGASLRIIYANVPSFSAISEVKIGTLSVAPQSNMTTYFKCTIPYGLTKGTSYPVVVVCSGTEYNIGNLLII